jgi:hypothetical protein
MFFILFLSFVVEGRNVHKPYLWKKITFLPLVKPQKLLLPHDFLTVFFAPFALILLVNFNFPFSFPSYHIFSPE